MWWTVSQQEKTLLLLQHQHNQKTHNIKQPENYIYIHIDHIAFVHEKTICTWRMDVIPYSRTLPSREPTTILPSPAVAKHWKFVPRENCNTWHDHYFSSWDITILGVYHVWLSNVKKADFLYEENQAQFRAAIVVPGGLQPSSVTQD
jgi:hypothetical protein